MVNYYFGLTLFAKIGVFFLVLIIGTYIWWNFRYSEEIQIKIVVKRLKKYFRFLFDEGFEVVRSDYSSQYFGNWSVDLGIKDKDYIIAIVKDRSYIEIDIIPNRAFTKNRIDLEKLINSFKNSYSAISGKKGNIDNQLKYFGILFYSNYDEIISYLNKEKPL